MTGWCGFDYKVISGDRLMKYDGSSWSEVKEVPYMVEGNEMSIAIPIKALGLHADSVSFRFKWADNMQKEDPMDWYVNGDTAPGSRFCYIYQEE